MKQKEKYSFQKYDKKYPVLFTNEKLKLRKILGNSVDIGHIGSTAVLGLGGKGIIDIAVGANKTNISGVVKKLIKNNYEKPGVGGAKNRIFLRKEYKYNGKSRLVHIHVTSKNGVLWNRFISFRDYLRENKKEIKKYEVIKKRAIKACKGEGEIYRKYKQKHFGKIK